MRLGLLHVLALSLLVAIMVVATAYVVRDPSPAAPRAEPADTSTPPAPSASPDPSTPASQPTADPTPQRAQLPMGGRTIFPEHFLVAYYGTAGTGSMGVLGESGPAEITERLRRAAAPYAASGRTVQIVYELIVTVADPYPGPDGDHSHDVARAEVRRYVQAARRNDALLVLDIQPGRSPFLPVAKRWEWALRKPWVGLALDPEWRMAPGEVPAQTIGQVGADEVNAVSSWLAELVAARDLPEKLFLLHQFRRDMVEDIARVRTRKGLAMVQHVDGFGTRRQKLSTHHRVARPGQFHLGFKLFYDEDIDIFAPPRVLRIRPNVEFVSYQ